MPIAGDRITRIDEVETNAWLLLRHLGIGAGPNQSFTSYVDREPIYKNDRTEGYKIILKTGNKTEEVFTLLQQHPQEGVAVDRRADEVIVESMLAPSDDEWNLRRLRPLNDLHDTFEKALQATIVPKVQHALEAIARKRAQQQGRNLPEDLHIEARQVHKDIEVIFDSKDKAFLKELKSAVIAKSLRSRSVDGQERHDVVMTGEGTLVGYAWPLVKAVNNLAEESGVQGHHIETYLELSAQRKATRAG